MKPRVTVIGIAYQHEAYIHQALDSLWRQNYPNLQVILMDDGSKDGSAEVIKNWVADKPSIKLLLHEHNVGYTKTFNEGLALAEGDYVIDFALDDVMLPGFIAKSVEALEKAGLAFGVCFSNADFINPEGKVTGNHYELLKQKGMIQEMPQGDIFEMVLRRYFISTPTMVIRKAVFDRLGGYDPELAYEDFDFWVRSSRYYAYCYLDEVLMQKRKLDTGMSASRLKHWQNEQLNSVYKVCEKAFALCKTKGELKALRERLAYEYRQCVRADHEELRGNYIDLIMKAGGNGLLSRLTGLAIRLGLDISKAKKV